jgi:phosphate starvation-inducible PhoH-like protein
MARRAARNKMRDRGHQENANIHTLYPTGTNWTPLESDVRDRKYVKNVRALSPVQQTFLDAIEERSVILALGPAGTGKTYLAIAKAVDALDAGRATRIVLSRPAVEAGESLGFLPGDVGEKLAPYLRPLYDALTERLGKAPKRCWRKWIENAPVAYMRDARQRLFYRHRRAQNCTMARSRCFPDFAGVRLWCRREIRIRRICRWPVGLREIATRLSVWRQCRGTSGRSGHRPSPLVGEMLGSQGRLALLEWLVISNRRSPSASSNRTPGSNQPEGSASTFGETRAWPLRTGHWAGHTRTAAWNTRPAVFCLEAANR